MLVVHVYVNQDRIDEIHIQNTRRRNKEGHYLYQIRKPEALNHLKAYHDRSKPWYFLVETILALIREDKEAEYRTLELGRGLEEGRR